MNCVYRPRPARSAVPILGAWLLMVLSAGTTRAEDWPQFRGPTGQGHSTETGLPSEWSESQNVTWKVPLDEGWSSPVVAGGRVWVTAVNVTRTARGQENVVSLRLVGLDAEAGRQIVNVEVFRVDRPEV